MLYVTPLRRLLIPAFVLSALLLIYRSGNLIRSVPAPIFLGLGKESKSQSIALNIQKIQPLPLRNLSDNYQSPPVNYFYEKLGYKDSNQSWTWRYKGENPAYAPLFQCSRKPNRYTGHIRLPNIVQNASQVSPDKEADGRVFWNPAIISLPWWSENQYLVVSRIVTDGHYQENVICEANICFIGSTNSRPGEKPCTKDDIEKLGAAGGLRCATPLLTLSVPPTPARRCEGKFVTYADIPGFHDPRVFWSGRGEPLMMVNTQSRYACFGLWIIDLRSLYPPLHLLLSSPPDRLTLGPLESYQTLTELTRNPASDRAQIEKNWMIFYPENGESYIHYDLSSTRGHPRGRSFAKLLGNGLTTPNLTDPLESPCLQELGEQEPDKAKRAGHWHQATNSLRVILCNRSQKDCDAEADNHVFVAVIHRKFENYLKLPLRYERYFMVWEARPPFHVLGVSKHPILMANETASGWTAEQNWDDWPFASGPTVAKDNTTQAVKAKRKRDISKDFMANHNTSAPVTPVSSTNATDIGHDFWAYFTYTVAIAWAWSGHKTETEMMNLGFIDDEIILSIGVDDVSQGFSRVKARDLIECLRACPSPRSFEDSM